MEQPSMAQSIILTLFQVNNIAKAVFKCVEVTYNVRDLVYALRLSQNDADTTYSFCRHDTSATSR